MNFSDMQYFVMLNINMRSRTVIKIRLHIPGIFLGYGRFVFKAKFYLETEGKGNNYIGI